MILRKYYDGEDILGLKVNGGQPIGIGGPCGAIVEKVKRGSVADLEGCIRSGKEHSQIHLNRSIDRSCECRLGSINQVYKKEPKTEPNQKLKPELPW